VVNVEYDSDGVNAFIQLADVVEEVFPSVMVQEREGDGATSARDGSFEVTHEDDTVLFSKLKEGRLPRPEEILEALEKKFEADGVDAMGGGGLGGAGCG